MPTTSAALANSATSPCTPEEVERYRAPALDKGLDILELLAQRKEGLTRTEITKQLGRNASEIYRMLERLVARQYVTRSSSGDRYTLSLKLFALAHRHPPMNRLIDEALPPMQRFADTAGQSCHLSVHDRGGLLVIAQVDDPGAWGITVRLGSRVGLTDTASGQLMLAFQTPGQREHMLGEHAKLADATCLDEAAFEAVAIGARQQGCLRQASRRALGVTDIAVPVLGPSGQAIAVLTCPYVQRIDTRCAPTLDEATELLRRTTEGLSMASLQAA
ncbi:IclR family transcriptional regulator [Burkholderia gladioli]|uniref:IclR family transcriptional regulator n=1 Tax=Burkholderia gladioli TaxID=28095 RepID=UPI001641B739|nr:IclR family transcriptional regulator [Burkholderia gladioli]MDA0575142.1 IclR family transcriptional regulator [Burkholderia gladioli]MDA0603381.1 IclR family transcriptional regulator [Burkholderia gladioli]